MGSWLLFFIPVLLIETHDCLPAGQMGSSRNDGYPVTTIVLRNSRDGNWKRDEIMMKKEAWSSIKGVNDQTTRSFRLQKKRGDPENVNWAVQEDEDFFNKRKTNLNEKSSNDKRVAILLDAYGFKIMDEVRDRHSKKRYLTMKKDYREIPVSFYNNRFVPEVDI
eukprot:TCONS_00017140-protein